MTAPSFKQRLTAGETLYSAWMSIPSPLHAEALAGDGWDAIVLDMQHGLIAYDDMLASVGAINKAGCIPVVRVPVGDDGLLGRVPDTGAEGIICPMINSGQDASWLARSTKYPPDGQRSWAPKRALTLLEMDAAAYLAAANDLVVTMAMVETGIALKNIDAICSTPGIDMIFAGPNDLCVNLTDGKFVDTTRPEVLKALELIVRKCVAHGKFAGAYANNAEIARVYRDMGFQLINVGNDQAYMEAGSTATLATAKS